MQLSTVDGLHVFMTMRDINYSKEFILVVDDEKEAAKVLENFLRHVGFHANHVESGGEAILELSSNGSYTFLITDIVMSNMDGLELTKRVKNDYPDMCIIAMTGFSSEYTYVDVINAGATDFINKPFHTDELEAKIRRGIIERNTQQELKKLSITDSLTGLFNQRHFYSRLNDEIIRAERKEQQFSLIFLDLDEFKHYNDKYGHLAGDELLQNFGNIINAQIRQGVDSAFRYGGDEFAIILCDADSSTCERVEKRIFASLKQKYGLDVSMGYAIFSKGMTPGSLVAEADSNLYKTKDQKTYNE